eukprot:8828697-Alexandrium_andersonii.AAC.1
MTAQLDSICFKAGRMHPSSCGPNGLVAKSRTGRRHPVGRAVRAPSRAERSSPRTGARHKPENPPPLSGT